LRRWDAAYREARRSGDLLTLELLDDAWAAAWQPSAGTEPGQSREERAEAAWGIYRGWVSGPGEAPHPVSLPLDKAGRTG
jgi:hypothetical protein